MDYVFGIHYATIDETNSMNAWSYLHSMALSGLQLLVQKNQRKEEKEKKSVMLSGRRTFIGLVFSMFDSNNSVQLGVRS